VPVKNFAEEELGCHFAATNLSGSMDGKTGRFAAGGGGRAPRWGKPERQGPINPKTHCATCGLDVNANRINCPRGCGRMGHKHVANAEAQHKKAMESCGPGGRNRSNAGHANGSGSSSDDVKGLKKQLEEQKKKNANLEKKLKESGRGGSEDSKNDGKEDEGHGKGLEEKISALESSIDNLKSVGMDCSGLQKDLDVLVKERSEKEASKKPMSSGKLWHKWQDKKKALSKHRELHAKLETELKELQSRLEEEQATVDRLVREEAELAKDFHGSTAAAVPPSNVLQGALASFEGMEEHPVYKQILGNLQGCDALFTTLVKAQIEAKKAIETLEEVARGGGEGGVQGRVPEGGDQQDKKDEVDMELEPVDFNNDDVLDEYYATELGAKPPEKGSAKRKEVVQKLLKQNIKKKKTCS